MGRQGCHGDDQPGPDAIPLPAIQLDVANWTLRFETTAKTAKGSETVAVEGKIEDLGSPHRTIAGSWRQGPPPHTFVFVNAKDAAG